MNHEDYEQHIRKILSKVPDYLRDDCRQAAYIGYLEAVSKLKKTREVKKIDAYIYVSMKNKVLVEVATMHGSGSGLFSMPASKFLDYNKYVGLVNAGEDTEDMGLSDDTKRIFSELKSVKRYKNTYPNGEPVV